VAVGGRRRPHFVATVAKRWYRLREPRALAALPGTHHIRNDHSSRHRNYCGSLDPSPPAPLPQGARGGWGARGTEPQALAALLVHTMFVTSIAPVDVAIVAARKPLTPLPPPPRRTCSISRTGRRGDKNKKMNRRGRALAPAVIRVDGAMTDPLPTPPIHRLAAMATSLGSGI
jgi:hypothetical protein